MRERKWFVVDVVWKGAFGTFEFSRKLDGEIEMRIPFLTPEPFTVNLQELVEAIHAVSDTHNA